MTEEKFVKRQIVLGAGASANDGGGYPLGIELIKFICQNNDVFIQRAFEEIVAKDQSNPSKKEEISSFESDLKKFIQALKNSSAQSIDSFIVRQSDENMRKVGYSLIAGIILSFGLQKIDWYGNLLPLIFPAINIGDDEGKKIEKLKNKLEELRLVTFNYDLSLEKFLYDFLKHNYLSGSNDKIIFDVFEEINKKIEHVYGSVIKKEDVGGFVDSYKRDGGLGLRNYFRISSQGEVVWAVSENIVDHGSYYSDSGCKNNNCSVSNAELIWRNIFFAYKNENFSSIKITEEERCSDNSSCSQLIKCDYLYVLGFGFDLDNINRIKLDGNICKKQVFITNYKGNQKIERIAINALHKIAHTNKGHTENKNVLIPIISHYGVKDALNNDFSLLEEPMTVEKIPLDKSSNGEYSPLAAYKSSLYSIKTREQKPHD